MVRNAPCIIGRTSIIDVSFRGMVASINCALQLEFSSLKTFFDLFFRLLTDSFFPPLLMHAEFQALSPLVLARHANRLQTAWDVVDALLTATARF